MKNYGDITQIHGDQVTVVDVINGGSTCEDLRVAGKRAGLGGERSGLFMDQIRIVKEMRQADVLRGRSGVAIRPRYMVWENVPGAFSSGKPKGADFAAVIEEIIKVCEEGASVSVRVPDGGWTKSGCYYAEDGSWSIAWRVHDAQFWGVPQRRKRIALVADFGGLSASEILFERKGLSRNLEPSGTAGEGTAGAVGGRVESAEPILLESNQNHATVQTDGISTALPASMGMGGGYVPMVTDYGDPCHPLAVAISIQGNTIDRAAKQNGSGISENVAHTLNSVDRHGVVCLNDQGGSVMGVSHDVAGALRAQEHGHQPVVAFTARGNGDGMLVPTLTGDHQNRVTDYTALCVGNGQLNQMSMAEQANTLDTMHDQQAVMVAAVDCRNGRENSCVNGTLQSKEQGYNTNSNNVVRIELPCGH